MSNCERKRNSQVSSSKMIHYQNAVPKRDAQSGSLGFVFAAFNTSHTYIYKMIIDRFNKNLHRFGEQTYPNASKSKKKT